MMGQGTFHPQATNLNLVQVHSEEEAVVALWGDTKGAVGPRPVLSKWMSHHPWSQHSWKGCPQALEKPWAGWE